MSSCFLGSSSFVFANLYAVSLLCANEFITGGSLVLLAPLEQKLLSIFFKRIDETITKQELLHELDSVNESSEGALRVYITKLRKIGLEIQTIKGVGYRLVKI